ncbi:MAG: TIGR01777 family oxidoreductase [Candidatus Nanopelagicales bacterium]
MKVVVTGSSGVIGTALVQALRTDGHDVVRLVRREPTESGEVRWHPEAGTTVDDAVVGALQGVTAAINLAGAGVGDKRWNTAYKNLLRSSRVDSTTALVAALGRLDPTPQVLLSGSAYGYYGDTGDTVADESTAQGRTFLAGLAGSWEHAAAPAEKIGIRVVYLRTGLVVSPDGGAFAKMLPLVRAGVGGRLGNGRQWWPFVSLRDHVAATMHLLHDETASGPYNLTAPESCTNADATAALGKVFGRPTAIPVPAFAVRAALGEFAEEVLDSRRVIPARLLAAGFTFRDPTITDAVATLIT